MARGWAAPNPLNRIQGDFLPASPLTRSLLAAYLPCAAAAVCLAAIYVHAEDPVYAWD